MAKARSYAEGEVPALFAPGRGFLPIGMQREVAADYLGVSLEAFDRIATDVDMPRPKSIEGVLVWDRWHLDQFQFLKADRKVYVYSVATVYVLGIPGFVRIGITTKSVADRINALQTGCPHPISLLHKISGTRMTESQLHKRFHGYRAAGEWFRNEGDLAEWINGGCKL